MPADTEFYDRLNVRPDADNNDIRKSYHQIALKIHPDRNPSPEAAEKFKLVSEAYEVLSDPQKRQLYDRYGKDGLSRSEATDPMVLFERFFGQNLFTRSRKRRQESTLVQLEVSLEESYNGAEKSIKVPRAIICTACNGNGTKSGKAPSSCKPCSGLGVRTFDKTVAFNLVQQIQRVCSDCNGKGLAIPASDKCRQCNGERLISSEKKFVVHVEKGACHEEKVVFQGHGNQAPDIEAGDLIVVFVQSKHAIFERRGNDLFLEKEITLYEALCGFRFCIPHLDGRTLVVSSQLGDSIVPDTARAIAGEGMPNRKNPLVKGNMYIIFKVSFPPQGSISREQIAMLKSVLPAPPSFEEPAPGEDVEPVTLSTEPQHISMEQDYSPGPEGDYQSGEQQASCRQS